METTNTKQLRETTREEREVFSYLNDLRQSGATNMFGAAAYIKREFNIANDKANKLLVLWMENFNDEGDYKTIIDNGR